MWTSILTVAIVILVVAIFGYWWNRNAKTIPTYVWVLMAVSVFLFVVAIGLRSSAGSSYDYDDY